MAQVRYPLNLWWRHVQGGPVLPVLRHHRNDGGVWTLVDNDTGRTVGYMLGQDDAVWWAQAAEFEKQALLAVEQALIARDVFASAVFDLDPLRAVSLRNMLRMPPPTHTDWISTLADETESALHLGKLNE